MNDKELADKIVACGVWCSPDHRKDLFGTEDIGFMRAEPFVRDWRVAGAMMEKIGKICVGACESCIVVHVDDNQTQEFSIESLPRAINEACCQVL